MKYKHFIFLSLLFCVITSCKSTMRQPSSHFVYSISEEEISDSKLNFLLTNFASSKIKSFVVLVNLEASTSDGSTEHLSFEKEFNFELESLEKENFSVDLRDIGLTVEDFENDFSELLAEDSVYLEQIYVSKIVFDDETVFTDKYGTWSF